MYGIRCNDIVENYHHIDMSFLSENGIVKPGAVTKRHIDYEGIFGIDIELFLEPVDNGVLVVSFPTGKHQNIEIKSSKPHYGGYRYWFECPETYNKCRKLYYDNDNSIFVSRQALGLKYSSQYMDKRSRLAEKAKAIREKLGGEPNLTLPFPEKPKHMHQSTYDNYAQQSSVIEAVFFGAMRAELKEITDSIKQSSGLAGR